LTADARVQLGELLRVRRRLAFRQFKNRPGHAAITILVICLLIPIPLALSFATLTGYLHAPEPWPAQILGMVLTALWFGWLMYPAFISPFNDSIDVRRLLVYPIRPSTLSASILVGTVFDYSTLFTVPFFGAIVLAWAMTPAFALALVAIALAYLHMTVIAQLVATTLTGVLQSRRFRDIMLVGGMLLGLLLWSMQFWSEDIGGYVRGHAIGDTIADLRPLELLKWTPPGAAAQAIVDAAAGRWKDSVVWIGYGAGLLAILGWAWWRVLVRVSVRGGALFSLPAEKVSTVGAGRKGFDKLLGWLGPQTRELVIKELRLLWRTPRRRMQLLQAFVMPAVLAVLHFRGGLPEEGIGIFPVALAFFIGLIVFQNTLGLEGAGLTSVMLSPLPRHRIFRAKGIALGLIAGVPIAIVSLVLFVVTRDPSAVAGLGTALTIGAAMLTASCVVSIKFPIKVPDDGKRGSGGGGLVAGLMVGLVVPLTTTFLSAPAWVVLVVGLVTGSTTVFIAAAVVGAVYGMVLFRYGTRVAGNLMLSSERDVYMSLELGKTV
jgi:ABC-2 type transport system permease protein